MKRKIITLKTFNKSRVFLAPMEEVNDVAFRILCKKAGASMTWTQLTSPLFPKEIILKDKPILQIFANNKEGIKEFMKKYDKKVSGWDLNLGCPAKTAKKHKYGAYLNDEKKVEEIIKLMRENTKKFLSIKIRKSLFEDKYLKIAEKYCDAITIHPRTKEEGYFGNPDIIWAKKFKSKSKIPVIYSGNIDEKNYQKFLEIFDYVMIGRNAIGRPEIFAKITKNKKFKKSFLDYLKLAKKYNLLWRNIKFQAMQFTKGTRDSRKLRLKIMGAKDIKDLILISKNNF